MPYSFASKSHLFFEPGVAAGIPLDAAATAYETPGAFALTLGDLARLQYVKSTLAYRLNASADPTGAEIEISVTVNGTGVATKTLVVTSATEYAGRFPVNLTDVAGQDEIKVSVAVTGAAGAGVTAELSSYLEVESPLMVGA